MNKFMEIAFEEAQRGMNNGVGGPFGAVIINKDGKVIAAASNEVLSKKDPTAHAEIIAIRRASKILDTYDLSGCVLYATGEPCPMCLSAIIWANIKEVYYGCGTKDAENIGFRDEFIYKHIRGQEDALAIKQIDRDECVLLFDEYAQNKKIIY